MKKTNTKRALLMSGLALIMCIAMLAGSTFAWFTDSVTSAGNIIKSGTLKVDLVDKDGFTLKGEVLEFVDMDDNDLWEPGCRYTLEEVYVQNKGNLALKYYIAINGITGDAKLLEAIDWVITVTNEQGVKEEKTLTELNGSLLPNQKSGALVIEGRMKQTAGNEYQGLTLKGISITVYATQDTVEADSFDNQYDKDAAIYVTNATEAQDALDNATKDSYIVLAPNVNYGTLYIRPSANEDVTKEVDWIGNNYRYETYTLLENVTILGASGAVVDAIEVEGGTYYNSEHSQSAQYPVMLSLVELKNVVIDGVTFTGNGGYDPQGHGNAINLSGNNIKVDGLTLQNCVLENTNNNARLLYKTESTTHQHKYAYDGQEYVFTPSLKDITVTGCKFNGGYIGLELRETENVTITNNVFNVADRNILLPVNTGYTYSGKITITGNVSNNAKERFVRADGTGDAVVVIKDNVLNAYAGSDADYIKVTNGNNVTIENNEVSIGASDTASLKNAIKNGGNIVLTQDIALTEAFAISNADFVLDGNGKTITMADGATNTYALFDVTHGTVTLKNVTFDGIKGGAIIRTVNASTFNADNVTVKNSNHTQQQGLFRLLGKNTITNCTFKNNVCSMAITLNYDGANNDPQVVKNCVFQNNTCNSTAVVYYVKGESCTLDGNTFVGNKVNCSSNGATVYMGFTENNTVINNVFQDNVVTDVSSSTRVAGGIFFGYATNFKNNAFINNKAANADNANLGNDVCISTYYIDIDISGNYWGGDAPVLGENYFVQHTNYGYSVLGADDYLTEYDF